jgi:kumamolisin
LANLFAQALIGPLAALLAPAALRCSLGHGSAVYGSMTGMSRPDPDRVRSVPLPGSLRPAVVDAQRAGPVADTERIEFTVVLRRRAPLPAAVAEAGASTPSGFAARYGADPTDVQTVTRALSEQGIEILDVHAGSRRIRAAASAGELRMVFGARLTRGRVPGPAGQPIEIRSRQGELRVPAVLDGLIMAVLGLDNRPQARVRTARVPAAEVTTSYTPIQLAEIYAFPDADGAAQTVAVIELGGGFAASDLDAYFGGLGLTTPSVRAVSVDGGQNTPGQDPNGADGEVLLDIEVIGAIAPRADQLVYFAPNTDDGFLDAISTAAHATPTPTALSISWGLNEDQWSAQARTAMDAALADASALGVSVSVAAGDDGSTDRATDTGVHTDFPAASPHVLGCGGTTLTADTSSGQIQSEVVWNNGVGQGATGGGVSSTFGRPDWQSQVGVPARVDGGTGRGVPDVAAVADPRTGYEVYVDGERQVIGGTSAVAPLWAGLVCRYAQLLGRRLGFLPPALYSGATAGVATPGFRDITEGNNGAYRAGSGWDPCTGLGVAVGTDLLYRLGGPDGVIALP